MRASRPTFRRRSAALLALGALVATSLLAGTALAATTTKPYTAEISEHSQPAGATVSLTITIVNQSNPQSLGSANWNLPTAFTGVILGAKTAGSSAQLVGSQIRLRDMNVLPGATYTLALTAIMPCVAGPYASSVIAKQSNDFSGPPGNDFTPNYPAANLVTTVDLACQLSVGIVDQPANAEVDAAITTVAYDPAGPPLRVSLLDATGALAPSFSVPVALRIGTNPGGGTLTAPSPNTSSGYASFPGASINASGLGYTLYATSTAAGVDASDPTNPFNIMDLGKICGGGPCSGSTTGDVPQSIYTVDAVAGAPGDRLDIGISLEVLDCIGYVEQTDVVTFNVFSITGTESIRTKTLTMQFRPDPKAPKTTWRVCYSSPDSGFVDRNGTNVPAGGQGLLRDCTSATDAPCMVSVSKVGKDIKIILRAPAGDPRSKG
jgi:hypothetical protein